MKPAFELYPDHLLTSTYKALHYSVHFGKGMHEMKPLWRENLAKVEQVMEERKVRVN